jgi:hypothetical protein
LALRGLRCWEWICWEDWSVADWGAAPAQAEAENTRTRAAVAK